MKKNYPTLLVRIKLIAICTSLTDLYLFNYSDQDIPDYITQDNMPASNRITDEGATLGRVLFYNKNLSVDNSVACANYDYDSGKQLIAKERLYKY